MLDEETLIQFSRMIGCKGILIFPAWQISNKFLSTPINYKPLKPPAKLPIKLFIKSSAKPSANLYAHK